MNKTPFFSIICPIYNASRYIKNSINSVICQEFSSWELILIDDGSNDGSGLICDNFAKENSKIRVIHQSNKGQSAARIKGISEASGEYLLFLDSDDKLTNDALSTLHKNLIDCSCDAVLFNANKISKNGISSIYQINGKKVITDKKQSLSECFIERIAGYFWMYCFKKSLFLFNEKIIRKFESISYSEDLYLIFNFFSNNNISLLVLPNVLYEYFIRDDSITNNQNEKKAFARFEVFNEVYAVLFNDFELLPSNNVYRSVGWTALSVLNRCAVEKEFSHFKEICHKVTGSFIYKKFLHFKKDRRSSVLYLLLKFRMYKLAYKFARKHK